MGCLCRSSFVYISIRSAFDKPLQINEQGQEMTGSGPSICKACMSFVYDMYDAAYTSGISRYRRALILLTLAGEA
jgi:hypothetical protein